MTKTRDELYDEYWQKFEEHLKNKGSELTMSSSSRRNGRTFIRVAQGLTIVAIPSLGAKPSLGVEGKIKCCLEVLLKFSGDNADKHREAFHQLHEEKHAIEDELGHDLKLAWLEGGESGTAERSKIKCCKIFYYKNDADWRMHYPWFIETIGKFDDVFTPRLEKIKF